VTIDKFLQKVDASATGFLGFAELAQQATDGGQAQIGPALFIGNVWVRASFRKKTLVELQGEFQLPPLLGRQLSALLGKLIRGNPQHAVEQIDGLGKVRLAAIALLCGGFGQTFDILQGSFGIRFSPGDAPGGKS
jgi:hypothetical protein